MPYLADSARDFLNMPNLPVESGESVSLSFAWTRELIGEPSHPGRAAGSPKARVAQL